MKAVAVSKKQIVSQWMDGLISLSVDPEGDIISASQGATSRMYLCIIRPIMLYVSNSLNN